jgi:hypothetical protein
VNSCWPCDIGKSIPFPSQVPSVTRSKSTHRLRRCEQLLAVWHWQICFLLQSAFRDTLCTECITTVSPRSRKNNVTLRDLWFRIHFYAPIIVLNIESSTGQQNYWKSYVNFVCGCIFAIMYACAIVQLCLTATGNSTWNTCNVFFPVTWFVYLILFSLDLLFRSRLIPFLFLLVAFPLSFLLFCPFLLVIMSCFTKLIVEPK